MAVETRTRIGNLFDDAKRDGRKPFIAYLTGGDPTPAHTAELILALERGGTDLIELGVPFSDPIADGPVIQRASERALAAGTKMTHLLDIVRQVRRRSEIPILLFSYMNPLLRYGFDKLGAAASEAGVDGVLMTDLCVEEAADPVRSLRQHGLDTVFLAAPTSSQRRLQLVAEHSSGFIYLVSRTGITGERQSLSETAAPLAAAVRRITDLPIAVGFGISTPEQVAATAQIADGVVVGSAIVKSIEVNGAAPDLAARLEAFTRHLTSLLPTRETA